MRQMQRSLWSRNFFFLNYEKSVLKPAQKIAFLGYIIDSVEMTVTLRDERKENILNEYRNLHKKIEAQSEM